MLNFSFNLTLQMEDILKHFSTTNEVNYLTSIFNFIICAISSCLLKIFYERYSNSIIPKNTISRILPVLSLITFLVILVVKTSLALSLGLVGALSIIRFRTPLKEPEELLYLFLSIGLGLGYGANQTLITISIFTGILLIIYFLNLKKKDSLDYNLSISFLENKNADIDTISNLIKNYCSRVQMVKFDFDESKRYNIIYKCSFNNSKDIKNFKDEVGKLINDFEISYFEEDIVY